MLYIYIKNLDNYLKDVNSWDIMYGYYDPPFSVEKEGISISVEKTGEQWVYRRTLGTDKVEKIILGDGKHLIINPVEPLNTPKEITPNLLIEFEKTLLLAGGEKKKIFLTFPIEIGVFISDKEKQESPASGCDEPGEAEIYPLWRGFKRSHLQALEKQNIFNFSFP